MKPLTAMAAAVFATRAVQQARAERRGKAPGNALGNESPAPSGAWQ
jgi:hypothetical protein